MARPSHELPSRDRKGSSASPPSPDGGSGPPEGAEELVGLLFQVAARLRQQLADAAADLDLTLPQAIALRHLGRPRSMGELAERLCCDASNVTGIVDRLESRGLVERRAHPHDRRVRHLVLTAAGRQLRRSQDERLSTVPLIAALSAGDRALLADLLRRASADAPARR